MVTLLGEHIRLLVDASNTVSMLEEKTEGLQASLKDAETTLQRQRVHVSAADDVAAVSEAFAAADSIKQVANIVGKRLPGLVCCEGATLFLLDTNSELWIPSVDDAGPGSPSPSSPSRRTQRLPITKGIVGAVASSGLSTSVAEAYDDPRFHPVEKTVQKLRTVLCVPVLGRSSGKTMAVLQLCNKAGGAHFSAEDAAFAERLA